MSKTVICTDTPLYSLLLHSPLLLKMLWQPACLLCCYQGSMLPSLRKKEEKPRNSKKSKKAQEGRRCCSSCSRIGAHPPVVLARLKKQG